MDLKRSSNTSKISELPFLVLYAAAFYAFIIHRSLHLSRDHYAQLFGLRAGWLTPQSLNDVSDAQWRNFRANLPVLTLVFAIFTTIAHSLRAYLHFKARGMSVVWLLISLTYLSYLHGACIIFILSIASANFLLVKIFARTKYFSFVFWSFNIFFLLCNRIYEGYSFSSFGEHWAFLDNFRGTFRWQICFNFVVLRMVSFGYDYHWAHQDSRFDHEKHIQRCNICRAGKTCYHLLQERGVESDKFAFITYLSYLAYAPLYLAGPILSFNAFVSQLDIPQNNYSVRDTTWYGLRWVFSLLLMELMTHLFYYNAFAISGMWKQLYPVDVFIIGYGPEDNVDIIDITIPSHQIPRTFLLDVILFTIISAVLCLTIFLYYVLIFMWLKFFLIWRYFRFWSLICGIEVPENMPKCVNNCYNLESFWKNWHASYNKWLVRYLYIPLGGSQRKLLNVWVVFTFVAIWHDLEWKLLSWAWLTCLFFIPEIIFKSAANAFQAKTALGEFIVREFSAAAGAITITCLMVANLVGFVIGPSGISWLVSQFLSREGLPVLAGMLLTFYVGTKLMFHIRDAKQSTH